MLLTKFFQLLRGHEPYQVLLEIAVIWVAIYLAFRFMRGTRGSNMIKTFAVVIVLLTLLMQALGTVTDTFARLEFLYGNLMAFVAILLVVVFQPELRQAMIRLGQGRWFRRRDAHMSDVFAAVGDAAEFLARRQFGALIAIERDIELGGLASSGVELDASVSSELLRNIFWPHAPLHDLGVVIRGGRVAAAGVQFPLAEEGTVPARYGSRHRAAIGVTLDSDCVAVIVSEESGAVSIAEGGRLLYDIPRETFRPLLAKLLHVELAEQRDDLPEPREVVEAVPLPTEEEPTDEVAGAPLAAGEA